MLFNIGYVCYRCGDRQRFLNRLCVLQVCVSADMVFNIDYVCYRFGDWQICCLI